MKTNQAFWDTSALVALCAREPASTQARQLLRQYAKPIVWWGTYAEAWSAFERTHRQGILSSTQRDFARKKLQQLATFWVEIVPNDQVRQLTLDLLEKYPLRTGDAFQLAAALVWCDEKPRRRTLVCFDVRFADLARQVGFTVIS
jgi:predicted nucleic acid-binding protein